MYSYIVIYFYRHIHHKYLSVSQTQFGINTSFHLVYNCNLLQRYILGVLVSIFYFFPNAKTSWCVCHICNYWNIYIDVNYCVWGYNNNILIIFRLPIPIGIVLHIAKICRFEFDFTYFKCLPICGVILL